MFLLTYFSSILTLLVTFLFSNHACLDTIQVNLKQGILSGLVNKTLIKQQIFYSFRGIPYAESPTGELRFLPSKEHKGWNDVYEAHSNKPTCLQYSINMRNAEPPGISGSEDCLYLNVFTSSLNGSLPVVVFDYNDKFRTGFNGTLTYSPDFFIEDNVIVATITHRLDIFGYLSTQDDIIPGNTGIKDFILGLTWIKENIHHFGGDPHRITLMGSNGGAALANILLYSQKAQGLFSNVIMQTGTALEPAYFYDSGSKTSFELGKQVDIDTNDSKTLLQELQKINTTLLADKMLHVFDNELLQIYQMNKFPFSPMVEHNSTDAVLINLPEHGKIVNDVPVLMGMNSREGLDSSADFIFNPAIIKNIDRNYLLKFPIRSNFSFDHNSSIYGQALKEVMDFYLNGSLDYNNILDYSVYAGDVTQMYAIDYNVKKLVTDLKSPVYYYMFDFKGALNQNFQFMSRYAKFPMENWGATVTDELCYLHLCTRFLKYYEDFQTRPSEPLEVKVLRKMVRLWTNFAKTGNPTPAIDDDVLKNFTWLPVKKDSDSKNYLHITKTLRMKKNPLAEREKFWDSFLEKYHRMAVNGVVEDKHLKEEL